VLWVRIMLTLRRANSAAISANRSVRPSAQRYSMMTLPQEFESLAGNLGSPVMLPPGRARLETIPVSIGSPAVANTGPPALCCSSIGAQQGPLPVIGLLLLCNGYESLVGQRAAWCENTSKRLAPNC
jgi:hypothetical protein